MQKKQELYDKACQAKDKAYAPYSHFKVGAAIYADNNKIYSSCNVENVSFPCGTCAEAGAISAMIADGATKIKEILVISDGKDLIYPCGACLQRILEFANKDTLIHLADNKKIIKTCRLDELILCNFNNLEIKHD